jgi:DNA-binding transcriptional ArsR family regulator
LAALSYGKSEIQRKPVNTAIKTTVTIPEIDSFIHEPARLRILTLLAMIEEADFMYILRETGLSKGNLSVQMTKLESAGLVTLDRNIEGQRVRTTYRLSPDGKKGLKSYKNNLESILKVLPG